MMKSSFLSILVLGILMFAVFSCEEDDFSSKHTYTDQELAWKDSIEAAKQNIKADYVCKFDVTLPVDTVNYTSVSVQADTVTLLSKLGMSTMAELTAAMGTVSSGAQTGNTISFFAIQNSTRYDNTEAYTANDFGHWFDANGDVCSWGDNDRLFSELDITTFKFNIGQHPKHLKTGETYKIIQAIKKGDYRVAFVFNITVGDYYKEEVPEAENVATYNLNLSIIPDNNYATTDLTFDFAAAATAMGISTSELSANETIYGISANGDKTKVYTADGGYFYTKDGNVCNWAADGCAVFVSYTDGVLKVGQYPEACQAGDTYTVKMAVMYKDSKMVTYNIKLTVISYVDPETPPTGDPVTLEKSYTLSQVYTGDWGDAATVDVKDVLKDAFKMTTYQIHKAIEDGTLVFSGLNADGSVYKDGDGNIASTATAPGHWYDINGNVTTWGSTTNLPECFSELSHTNESLVFNLGNHPENAKAGDEITFKQVAELNGGKVTFTFTFKVVAARKK